MRELKMRITIFTIMMLFVVALGLVGIRYHRPVKHADGGPIPTCAPGTPGQPKQGPCKPYDPNHPF